MGKKGFLASYTDRNANLHVDLIVLSWEEDNVHYEYSPALDLTGYGNSEEEAKASFEVTLGEFLKYTNNKNTLFAELERLGWLVNERKKRVSGPDINQMLKDNETYKELSSRPNVKTETRDVALVL